MSASWVAATVSLRLPHFQTPHCQLGWRQFWELPSPVVARPDSKGNHSVIANSLPDIVLGFSCGDGELFSLCFNFTNSQSRFKNIILVPTEGNHDDAPIVIFCGWAQSLDPPVVYAPSPLWFFYCITQVGHHQTNGWLVCACEWPDFNLMVWFFWWSLEDIYHNIRNIYLVHHKSLHVLKSGSFSYWGRWSCPHARVRSEGLFTQWCGVGGQGGIHSDVYSQDPGVGSTG